MKKLFYLLPITLLFLATSSCVSVRVASDYDRNANFNTYKTFAFFKDGIDKAEISDLDKRRILRAVEAELLAKGYTKSENPDLLVSIFTKSRDKVNIYNNENGFPGKPLSYQNIVFRVTEKDGDEFSVDVSAYDIYIPKTGLFISIQVLGYTDSSGKLLPNKKYKEIKSREGIVKIPTNFRPLLPFTDEIPEYNTFIKRVFLNKNQWAQFKKGSINDSSLLSAGLNNYGMGISFNIYKDE